MKYRARLEGLLTGAALALAFPGCELPARPAGPPSTAMVEARERGEAMHQRQKEQFEARLYAERDRRDAQIDAEMAAQHRREDKDARTAPIKAGPDAELPRRVFRDLSDTRPAKIQGELVGEAVLSQGRATQ